MKTKLFTCAALAAGLILVAQTAHAGGVVCAIDSALESKSPLGSRVEIFDHAFTVKPVNLEKDEKAFILTGTLDRVSKTSGKTAAGDTVAYRIVKHGGAVKEIKIQVNGAMWQSISPALTKALAPFTTGEPMPDAVQANALRAMEKSSDKTWQSAAELLIAQLAVRHC